ncbi:hypothetical protein [Cobetia amphilecti]|uniref:hypothetical protein n=1 Tax=Cobetia amphilecti TaxID=1055104 RepID=UPI0032975F21
MASEALKRRMKRLEAVMTPDEGEPLVIFLNCINGADSRVVMAVIAGTTKQAGETLRRTPDETADAFTSRVEQRCTELHGGGIVEVELHD